MLDIKNPNALTNNNSNKTPEDLNINPQAQINLGLVNSKLLEKNNEINLTSASSDEDFLKEMEKDIYKDLEKDILKEIKNDGTENSKIKNNNTSNNKISSENKKDFKFDDIDADEDLL